MASVPALSVSPPTPPPAEIRRPWHDGLTAKMVAFSEHYYRYRNATQAYKHAFDAAGSSYETCRNEGSRLLADPRIQRALKERYKLGSAETGVDIAWLLNHFLTIAMADPRELIGLKVGCCRFCWGEGHGYQWREREYLEQLAQVETQIMQASRAGADTSAFAYPDPAGGLDFNATLPPHPDCPQCHGEGVERFVPRDTDTLSDQALLLYGGVKVKPNGGYEIIIADRAKAAELAGRILGAFTDKVKISGVVGHMHAVADLRKIDPQEAAKAYRDFVAGHLALPSG